MNSRTDLKNMFDKSVKGTVDLISRQVLRVQEAGGQVEVSHWYLHTLLKVREQKLMQYLKNIFLSGGFSENEYLFNEVKAFADRAVIDLQRADDWFVDYLLETISRLI
jgi:hypothetical protein